MYPLIIAAVCLILLSAATSWIGERFHFHPYIAIWIGVGLAVLATLFPVIILIIAAEIKHHRNRKK
jgi:hypothetical protein